MWPGRPAVRPNPPPCQRIELDMSEPIARRALAEIWRAAGHSEAALEAIDLTGAEPVLPSSFPVGSAAQATIAAAAMAAGEDTDVFVQGYRPGAIAAFGFGPQDVARVRPGIIYV